MIAYPSVPVTRFYRADRTLLFSISGLGPIGPMIEIESAQIVLVRLPLAAVLTDDQARNRLQHVCRPSLGANLNLFGSDNPGAGRVGDVFGGHHHRLARLRKRLSQRETQQRDVHDATR